MRAIKFRAIYKGATYYSHDNEGYPGYLDLYNGQWEVRTVYENGDHGEDIVIKHVDEYTGLKDKNGKEIYEGDILSVNINEENPAVVCKVIWYYAGWYMIGNLKSEERQPDSYNWMLQTVIHEGEVIGNIYEDSHLLDSNS